MISRLFFIFVVVILVVSCGKLSQDNSKNEYISEYSSNEYEDTDDSEYDNNAPSSIEESPKAVSHNIDNIRLTGDIVQCNKCMGYGMVQEGMNGQPEICKFCWASTYMRVQQGWQGFDGRFGQVDAVFNTLPADYFDDLDWNANSEYDSNGGGNSTEQIESEIARHEENIAQLEHQLEYIDGSINRTLIQQQITEEQYEIRRLKAMLNDM